jgi:acid phosphatase family membrane protein YuiD
MATMLSAVFAVSVGFASTSIAQSVAENSSPLTSLGVFSAVVAAFIFMLKRSDGRDTQRINELTKIIVDLREDLKKERLDHDATRADLVKVLKERAELEDRKT